jgi:hypothetical protein
MRTIGIIYDTSYLMLNEKNTNIRELVIVLNHIEFRRETKGWFSVNSERTKFSDHFCIEEIVPIEVANEIYKHFSNPDKEMVARSARKKVAALIESGAKEVCLSGVDVSNATNSVLGADSQTDRKQIAYALSMVEKSWDLAIIATDDGGILYDIVKLCKEGKPIRCHTKERRDEFASVATYLAEIIGWDLYGRVACASSWKIYCKIR